MYAKDDQPLPWFATGNCARCGRELREWPLHRGDVCSPADWVYCVREVAA